MASETSQERFQNPKNRDNDNVVIMIFNIQQLLIQEAMNQNLQQNLLDQQNSQNKRLWDT